MNHSASLARRAVALGGLLVLVAINGFAAPPPDKKLTDPVIAEKLGVSVQQLHELREEHAFSDDQLLHLSFGQVQLLLGEIELSVGDHPGEAIKFRALRMQDEHGRIPADGLMRAQEYRRRMRDSSSSSLAGPGHGSIGPRIAGIETNGWTWLGPGNLGGRIRSLLVHPFMTNTMWVGGIDGGVWKTTNSGAAWFPLDDFMANLAVSCMAIDLPNPDILYAGTGEGTYNADAIRGAGIFKTTDGGNTWTQLVATATPDFNYVNRLSIAPGNDQTILAATRGGIFITYDAGTSWTQVLTNECLDVAFDPLDNSQAVASGFNGQAWYSFSGGSTWNSSTGIPAQVGFVAGRVELAYGYSFPATVYASVDESNGAIYASGDGGQTYSLRTSTNYNYIGSNGWYHLCIWVDPSSTNNVIVGGVDLWRSSDGGVTLTQITDWTLGPPFGATSPHADYHVVVNNPIFDPFFNRTVFVGNDGGVARAINIDSVSPTNGWTSLNNNLGIAQFYSGVGNSNTSVIVGGTQDNGTIRYTPGGGPQAWTTTFGGDGGFCAADQGSTNFFYGEYVYLQIYRSTNTAVSASYITNGLTEAGSTAVNFIAPFVLDPSNPNRMYAGGLSLWRTANVKATNTVWTSVKPATNSPISAIAVSPSSPNVVWVGHNNGDIYSTGNALAPTPTWIPRSVGSPLPSRYCTRLAIGPTNPNCVYATFGGFAPDNVWQTSDGGINWTNISANLPPAPVNSIVIGRIDTNTLYVGSEVGVFATSGGGFWSIFNDGPANVAVDELFWLGTKLVAATHGRGMFTIVPYADLALEQTAASPVTLGDNITYTIFVSNRGPVTATSVTVTDAVPGTAQVVFLSSSQGSISNSGGIVSCNIGTLTNSAAAIATIVAKTLASGTIFNTAVAGAAEPDISLANNSATTAVIVPVDADADGMDDAWELAYGFDPHDSADAARDKDGDGTSNLQEFLTGTDPTNNASAFRITAIARVANTNILVTWTMGSGKTNALQRTTGDASGSYRTNGFTDIFTVTNTVGTTTNRVDSGAATNVPSSYYRVRLVP